MELGTCRGRSVDTTIHVEYVASYVHIYYNILATENGITYLSVSNPWNIIDC